MPTIPINDTAPRNEYTATAGQTAFTYSFWIPTNDSIKVYQNGTLLTLTTHYTVSGVLSTSGGTVTLVSGATLDDEIVLVRDIPIERITEFSTSGDFAAETMNLELSRFTAIQQQLETKLGRAPSFPDSSTVDTSNIDLPDPVAGTVLGVWNAAGTAVTAPPAVDNGKYLGYSGGVLANLTAPVNGDLPAIAGGDAGKFATVNSGETAIEYTNIESADLPDNGVTLAKLAGGTAGALLGFDGSGDPSEISLFKGIKQIKVVNGSSTQEESSGTWTDITGATTTLTPASTSSTVLAFFSMNQVGTKSDGTTNSQLEMQILRDATAFSGSFVVNNGSLDGNFIPGSILGYDSPASASSLTYKVQFRRNSGDQTARVTGEFNLVLIEIDLT